MGGFKVAAFFSVLVLAAGILDSEVSFVLAEETFAKSEEQVTLSLDQVLELIKIRVDATIKNLCECLEKLEKSERRAKENDAI